MLSSLEDETESVIVIGLIALAVILLAEALLQWKYLGTSHKGGNAACILFIFIYIGVFQVRDRLTSQCDGRHAKVRGR